MFETRAFEKQIRSLAFMLWDCEFLRHVVQYLSTWRSTAKEKNSSSNPDPATSGENQLPLTNQKWWSSSLFCNQWLISLIRTHLGLIYTQYKESVKASWTTSEATKQTCTFFLNNIILRCSCQRINDRIAKNITHEWYQVYFPGF